MSMKLKILFTGDYLKDYNRTSIIVSGLKKLGHDVIEFPFQKKNKAIRENIKLLSEDSDFVFMPSFTHQQVGYVRKVIGGNKKIIFDPLISRYLTKIHDYKLVSPYGLSALRNYLRDKLSQKYADFVVTDTQAHKEYFHKKFGTPLEKMGNLYIGNNFDEFYSSNEPINPSHFLVGFYGGFIPLQGVMNIIDAAYILKDELDISFELIGNGFQYEEAKRRIVSLNLKNIILLGWLDVNSLRTHIQKFNLALGIFGETEKSNFVIPNKVYHYVACGKAVITKDSPAIRELFKHNENMYLTDHNPKNIADAILNLKKNPNERIRIAKNAYELLHKNYNETAVAQRLIDYFLQIKN
jgi:glycosyltransferase involved in cell wall biosynthesis